MNKGYWTKEIRIKADATPIDDVTKFAWDDDDYEEVDVWYEYTDEELENIDRYEQEHDLFENGNKRLKTLELSQNDLILAIADILGGNLM